MKTTKPKTKKAPKPKAEKRKKPILFQSPKGMHDILPDEQVWWSKIRRVLDEITEIYNFSRIDTPILEDARVFEAGVGASSDIVEKQMFVFKTKGGDRLALRPEGTAPIMRSYFQNGLGRFGQPLKLFYFGPMFRYEQPQAGRTRQFHQAGFEIIGDDDAVYDAQTILAVFRLLEKLRIKDLSVRVNSIGCRVCRPVYRRKIQDYYKNREERLCGDCRRRLGDNPLRLLDCKNENCAVLKEGAPIMLDVLCGACRGHFKRVLEFLNEVNIPYALDNHLVRGLDYYNRTVFEIFSDYGEEGKPFFTFALAGGGRYDYLSELIGGRPICAVGAAVGWERVVELMKKNAKPAVAGREKSQKVFFVHIGDLAKQKGFGVMESLRQAGIVVSESLGKDLLKAQMRLADKEGAAIALIFGQKEVFEDSIIVRDMRSGAQEAVPLKDLAEVLKKRLKTSA